MRYLSVCSGIEAASVAWHPLGWQAVAFAEIEAFPCAVLKHHYPDVPNWGDLTKFKEWPDAAFDVLVGGTPCQSFSVAGLRKGLDDPRGNLALTYLAVLDRYRPTWCVWENVPGVLSSGGGRDFGAFLGGLGQLGYGFAYRVLDAQFFGIPQRRRRVFVVGCLGGWQRAAAVLFDGESLCGHPPPRRETGTGAPAGALGGTSPGGGWRFGADEAAAGQLIPSTGDISHCLNAGGMGRIDGESETMTPVAHALRGEGFDASEDGTGRGTPIVSVRTAQTSANGHGIADNVAHTLDGTQGQAIAFSVKDHGADAGDIAPTLRSGGHDKSHANGGVMPAIAFDARQSDVIQYGDKTGPLDTCGFTMGILGGSNGNAAQAGPVETLQALREAIGEEAFSGWVARVLAAFWPEEVLRSAVHGLGLRYPAWSRDWLVYCALALSESCAEGAVQSVREAQGDGRASQGWQPSKQHAQELGAYLSELSHAGASAEAVLQTVRQASQGSRLLQSALSAFQKLGRSEHRPTNNTMAVRRLTPVECEFLQGFPRNYTLIPYRNKPAADGNRYKALGNSMAVPVMAWIGRRIDIVHRLHPERAA